MCALYSVTEFGHGTKTGEMIENERRLLFREKSKKSKNEGIDALSIDIEKSLKEYGYSEKAITEILKWYQPETKQRVSKIFHIIKAFILSVAGVDYQMERGKDC